jgi:hypothetical protein
MNKALFPKITFGIIVLNGEPFTRYCLRSIYPFAYEIIVVEGGHVDARSVCTPDGHSVDGTLESLYKFKKEEDTEDKLTIVTKEGFWPKKDELGYDRTPQSRAYAERATGDYLWQVDIDEFYKASDMIKIIEMLKKDKSISTISFKQKSFWGDIKYISDSVYLRDNVGGWHRIFKWDKSMYHYSLLFPWQVEQKVKVYRDEKPDSCSEIIQWAENNFFKLGNPYRVHNIYKSPSWLERFNGEHPEQVLCMMNDIKAGKINAKLRRSDDVEVFIDSNSYKIGIILIKIEAPLKKLAFQLMRIKNIPNRIRKILNKNKLK